MRRFIRFIICLLLFLPALSEGEVVIEKSSEEILFEANQAYKEGRFQNAVEGYLRLIEDGLENGHIYYNLGNAFFRLEDLGKAILFYERARLFIPRDADLNFNLSYARDQALDVIDAPQGFISQSFFWLDELNVYEIFLGFTFINILFFGILFIRLFHKAEWTYYAFILFLIFTFIGASSLALKWYQWKTDDRAVILAETVDVVAGPDPQDTVLFKLHEGAVVHHERSEDGWCLIHLSSERRGWIRSLDVERIIAMND
jgi:tetratricopeptide (TPR) repeat protein